MAGCVEIANGSAHFSVNDSDEKELDMQRRTLFRIIGLGIAGGMVSRCGSAPSAGNPLDAITNLTGPSVVSSTPLSIAIASSLAGVMQEFGAKFVAQYGALKPEFEAASSSAHALQIIAGARFDIFIAADMVAMLPLIDAKIIKKFDIHPVAQSELIIVARPEASVASVADLSKPGLKIVIADEKVPVGRYTNRLLRAIQKRNKDKTFIASFTENVVSYEEKASAVTQKFFSGEADVAVMYAADVHGRAANTYTIVPLPKGVKISSTYLAALLPNPRIGSIEFVNMLTNPEYNAVWSDYGFRTSGK